MTCPGSSALSNAALTRMPRKFARRENMPIQPPRALSDKCGCVFTIFTCQRYALLFCLLQVSYHKCVTIQNSTGLFGLREEEAEQEWMCWKQQAQKRHSPGRWLLLPVPGHASRLVHRQHCEHEQYYQGTTGGGHHCEL